MSSGNGNTSEHKITVLKAKKKIAVRATAQPDVPHEGVKEAVPAPKMSEPTTVNEPQEGNVEVPSAPETKEKGTEQEAEKKAPADKTEQSSPQSNQAAPSAPFTAPALTPQNNEQEVQAEPESTGNGESVSTLESAPKFESEAGEKLPTGEETAQPVIQDSEDNGATPSLPPIPEVENDRRKIPSESDMTGQGDNLDTSEARENIPVGEPVAQPAMENSSEEKEVIPSLPPLPEAENDGQETQSKPAAIEKKDDYTPSEFEEKISTDDVVQPEIQSSEERAIVPSLPTIPPEVENEEQVLQPPPLTLEDALPLPDDENKTPENEVLQPEPQSTAGKEKNSSTTYTP